MTRNDSFGRTCKASIGRTGGAAKTAGQPAIPDRTGPSGRRLVLPLNSVNLYTVKIGYCEIQGTEFLARYRRNSLLPIPAVEEFSLTEP